MHDRMNLKLFAAVAAAAIAGLAAPASAQTPGAPETFRLTEVAGAALPTMIEEEDGCREEVLSGSLTLNADGSWTLITREREVCGDSVEEEDEQENGRYLVEGDTIRFHDDAEDEDDADDDDADDDDEDLDLDDLTVGTRSADTLTVRLDDGRTVLVFRR